MRSPLCSWPRPALLAACVGMVGLLNITGCGSGGSGWEFIGSPFSFLPTGTDTSSPTSTGQTQGGQFGEGSRTPVDPCIEPLARKFVTISMRNESTDYVHYFFVAIAFVDVDETAEDAVIPAFDFTPFPDGAVCPQDISLYRQNKYIEIGDGQSVEFGDYCITGPALYYYHENGRFRTSAGAGSSGLGSAIAPAQGNLATYDAFFDSIGGRLPVPDLILFHNPSGALKISRSVVSPCAVLTTAGDPVCERDSFYYVSEDDTMAGSRSLGLGSGRRTPLDIQGTGCECTGLSEGYQILAPSGVTAVGANCNEFLRGGRIDYVFVRIDETPLPPQLLWRVTDAAGGLVHDFDSRARIPGG